MPGQGYSALVDGRSVVWRGGDPVAVVVVSLNLYVAVFVVSEQRRAVLTFDFIVAHRNGVGGIAVDELGMPSSSRASAAA